MTGPERTVALAGATGDLGARLVSALRQRGVTVRALVRPNTAASRLDAVRAHGGVPVAVDLADRAALARALQGAECVISTLNGLEPVILGAQAQLLDAAVRAGVPRFISSDFALDFTRTSPGGNRNLDLRRRFMAQADAAPIRVTSVLNGAFADLLVGPAPILLRRFRKVLFWGDDAQRFDFTTKDDVADFTADAALDADAPRILRISGNQLSPRDLAALMTRLDGRAWSTLRGGSIERLSGLISLAQRLAPGRNSVFLIWQGLQYLRDMSSGLGKLDPLDNSRYGKTRWTKVQQVLAVERGHAKT